ATPLAGRHFAAAIAYLLAASIGIVWIAPDIALGAYASPHVAGVTHLITLGWISVTIFGALCQLLPVALGSPLRWMGGARLTLLTFAPGAGIFALGIATGITALNPVGLLLLTTGIVTAAINVGASLHRSKQRDVTWAAIALAMSFLVSTLILGAILLHNLHSGFIADARFRVLGTHLHIALVGWALMMIVGVSHRLLPMFLLSHGADTSWTRRSIVMLSMGLVFLVSGLLGKVASAAWVGAILLEVGVACFYWQVRCFYRSRVKKKTDIGLMFVTGALISLGASAILGPVLLAKGPTHGRLATAYIALGLLGGITMYVVGLYYKIVPLLAWTTRYGSRMGKEKLPAVTDMYSARVAWLQLGSMFLAVTLLFAGIAAASPHVARCGAVLFLGGVLLFAGQIARIAYGGPA
ncbi:MAG TPA: hypothetical protein VF042_06830, partial [Gemmatimonadaceae bacterium]